VIRKKQESLLQKKDELFIMIKPSDQSSYKDVMTVLDEMLINNIKRYAVVDPGDPEKSFLKKK
jgi:biopolymer transport protein ExbD